MRRCRSPGRCSITPTTRKLAGRRRCPSDAVADAAPAARAIADSSTTTGACARSSAGVYQRPCASVVAEERLRRERPTRIRPAADPRLVRRSPAARRPRPASTGSATPRARRTSGACSSRPRSATDGRSRRCASGCAIDVPRPRTASSVPTANAICRIVATLRRLRRPTLRTPICAVGAGRRCGEASRSIRDEPPDLGAGRRERLGGTGMRTRAADRGQRREHRADEADGTLAMSTGQ